jgi:ankyrin repeat protein
MEPTTSEGMLPLHLAASFVDEWRLEEMVQVLVEQAPQAVRCATRQGLIPLQCAVRRGSAQHLPVVQRFLQAWPESVRIRDLDGNSLLHMAVAPEKNRSVEQILLGEGPHRLLELMRHLLQQQPQLIREPNVAGSLPAHVAVAGTNMDELELVQVLVESQPSTLLTADATGSLPLHVALAQQHVNVPLVHYLVEQQPQTLELSDPAGSLPVHVAVDRNIVDPLALALVQALVERRPATLLRADASGSLPLHVALAQQHPMVNPELVHYLVEAQPLSLEKKDARGWLPLHLAAANDNVPLEAVYILALRWPEAVYGRQEEECASRRPVKRPKRA